MNLGTMVNQGWQCPVCGYVYSPTTPICYNCNRPDHLKFTTTTSITIQGPSPDQTGGKAENKN